MRTPYDLMSVAQTYRATHIRSDFAKAHIGLVAENINRQIERDGSVRVLDIGCGAGGGYKLLSDRPTSRAVCLDYVGLDEAQQQIELATADHKSNDRVRFVAASAESLPFSDNHFDIVFECRLFQFVRHPIEVLSEMTRTSRNLVIATLYTSEQKQTCFHPFYSHFEMDENRRILSGGEQLRELSFNRLVSALLMRDGLTNRYCYPFAKQMRTLPGHAELEAYIGRFAGHVLHRDVVTRRLDTIIAPDGADTGLTQQGDRLEYPIVRRQTLVLTKQ
jgi:ubiquinone/menaquinone biosynthesis C-methylase UbiE